MGQLLDVVRVSIADDRAKSLAYWEWLRTANPLLPPFHMVKEAEMNDLAELTMTVSIVRPAEPFRFDPWEAEMAASNLLAGSEMWSNHLCSAISNVACLMRPTGSPSILLVYAAQAIRAMAPEGTKWDEPALLVPGGDRPRLRSIVKSLLEADKGHSACFRNEGSVTYHLVSAEASLHALWLAAQEQS
jgi:hypothetical protein